MRSRRLRCTRLQPATARIAAVSAARPAGEKAGAGIPAMLEAGGRKASRRTVVVKLPGVGLLNLATRLVGASEGSPVRSSVPRRSRGLRAPAERFGPRWSTRLAR